MSTTTKSRGCGCGGTSKGSCGCGCKSATAAGVEMANACASCDDAAFVRPQFFAGQLLTEDDLTALETYVIGKHRLHNAKLFGDGVVCGLDVTCGPCNGTTVRVAPGYALDCCGNDLVLTCDREIDLRPMIIIALRDKTHRGDCGDPCPPAAATPVLGNATATTGHAGDATSPIVEYGLYLRYTETASDPIANYPSADDCQVTCQPTRVREGVTFELRCPDTPVRDDLVTRLEACIDRLSSPDRQISDTSSLGRAAFKVRRALPLMDKDLGTLDPTETERWNNAQPALQQALDRATDDGYAVTGDDLVQWTDLLIDVGGLWLRGAGANAAPMTTAAAISTGGDAGGKVFNAIADKLAGDLSKIASLLDRQTATEASKMWKSLVTFRPGPSAVGLPTQWTYAQKLFLRGALYTRDLMPAYIAAAHDLRARLLQVLSCDGGDTTDCTLYDDLRQLSLPSTSQIAREVEAGDATDLAGFAWKLGEYVKRFFLDCFCRALNPPCRPCDDPAVLLACVKIRDCHVIEVCNLARTFVWSPAAMRYWLPPVSWLGQLVQTVCCGAGRSDDVTKAGTSAQARFVLELLSQPSLDTVALALPAFYGRTAYLPTLIAATRGLGGLAMQRLLPTELHAAPAPSRLAGQAPRDLGAELQQLTARIQALETQARR